ncbi:MAG TPA: hypothetical protein DCW93_01845 [Saprospirales bacterium]|nr:hypothetical protein [Saprospirales bacterium]
MSFRGTPHGSKYQINHVPMSREQKFGSDIRYSDLLLAAGPKHAHYEELIALSKTFYSPMSETLSKTTTPFMDWVSANGGMMDVGKNQVRWRVYGTPATETSITQNPYAASDLPGAGNEVGHVILDNEFYKPQDLLYPVGHFKYEIMLQSFAEPVGANSWRYEFKTTEKDTFIPVAFFDIGRKWDRKGSVSSWIDTMTYGSSEFQMNYTYLEFAVNLTTFTKAYSVDEETHLQDGTLIVSRHDIDSDANMERGLINKMELEHEMTYRREKELLMMTGRSSDHHRDINSKQLITTAPGFFEFMEEAQIMKYNPKVNNLDMFSNILDNFWYDRVPMAQRNIMLMTGEGGLKLFHNWVKERFDKEPVLIDDSFVLGEAVADEFSDRMKRSYGTTRFFKYNLDLFGSITVGHWAMLDNPRVFGESSIMPGTNKPASSFEFIAMDMGIGAKPNIKILTRNEKRRRTVTSGYWSPFGAVGVDNPRFSQPGDTSLGDAYKIEMREVFGLAIDDLSSVLRMVPEVQ